MTRDPARIDPILADLRRYWHAAPDLRLGQMVMGLLNLSGAPRYGEFNAEDDKVAAYLAAWAAANQPPPDHRDTMPPEIEAAIADAGQALVDAWDSAQDGPPHRFVVFVDPEGDPEVAAGWMAMARMHAAAIAAAREAGVQMFTGTDAGGFITHGRIVDEIEALVGLGWGPVDALAAASVDARRWLGAGGLAEGDRADFLVVSDDPRESITTLRSPTVIMCSGLRIV